MKRIRLPYRPRKHQREIHEALRKHRFGVLVCHRRFGKTVCGVNALNDAAVRFVGGDGRFGYVAPLYKQAKRASWDYFKRYARAVPGTKFNESELTVAFANGSKIYIDGADNPDGLRGSYYDGVVLDEVAQMKNEVWGEVVRPMLSDRKGWALFIGTPKGQNVFSELYEQAQRDNGWYAGMYRADETDVIPDDELALAKSVLSDAQYRQEYLCDFSASADNVLLTIDVVSAACARIVISEADLRGFPKILGVDVARFGDDDSVLIKRWGRVAFYPEIFHNIDNMSLAGIVADRWQRWKPDAVMIDGGRGEGVIDRLRQLGFDAIEVNAGGKATNPRYHNKRTEMWCGMAEWVADEGVLPNHSVLKGDLCAPTYRFDAQNRWQLEANAEIKQRLGRSPDCGSALAQTFAFPVMPTELGKEWEHQEKPGLRVEYDPYEDHRMVA